MNCKQKIFTGIILLLFFSANTMAFGIPALIPISGDPLTDTIFSAVVDEQQDNGSSTADYQRDIIKDNSCCTKTEIPKSIKYTIGFSNPATGQGQVFLQDENTYYLPAGTLMEIKKPVTKIKNTCGDLYYYSYPQMRATIFLGEAADDLKIIKTATDSEDQKLSICKTTTECVLLFFCEKKTTKTPICAATQENFKAFEFPSTGTYTVKIEHALTNECNAANWTTDKVFTVKTINPLISIGQAQNKIITFSTQNEIKTSIAWAVKNISEVSITLQDANSESCAAEGITCSANSNGITLLPGASATIMQEITVKKPVAAPQKKTVSFELNYSDNAGITKKTAKSTPANLTILFEETGKFNIKMFSSQQADCIGSNGETGQTGSGNIPKVLFAWDWASITKNSCDKKILEPDNYIYCDPAQFGIELLKKLFTVEEELGKGKSLFEKSITDETEFLAYLIGDNYSDDFRKDFDQYYIQAGFFNAESFYTQRNFDKYFPNPAEMEFVPKKIDSGLYSVKIEITPKAPGASFLSLFKENQPNAKIKVLLTKKSDPNPKNPLYYYPINGDIGKYGIDSDGKIERKDYGIKYSGETIKIKTDNTIKAESISGAKTLQTAVSSTFEKTNLSNRGILLTATKDKIEIAPQKATPVLAKATAKEMRAEIYYLLKKQSNVYTAGMEYENFWTGIASSTKCTDFLGKKLFNNRQDTKADETNCAAIAHNNLNAYGYEWPGIPATKENNYLYLQTIFFTPEKENYTLENACPAKATVQFFGPNSKNSTTSILLNYTKETTDSIEAILELVKTKKACIAITNGELKVFWNTLELNKALEAAKAIIPTGNQCKQN